MWSHQCAAESIGREFLDVVVEDLAVSYNVFDVVRSVNRCDEKSDLLTSEIRVMRLAATSCAKGLHCLCWCPAGSLFSRGNKLLSSSTRRDQKDAEYRSEDKRDRFGRRE